jgi:hypothetical protein
VRHKLEAKEDKHEFKLKRFQNVEPKTNTNRPVKEAAKINE